MAGAQDSAVAGFQPGGSAAASAAVGIRRASIAGGASAAAATASRISGTYSSAGPAGWAKAGALARRARTGKIICFIMNSPFTCQLEHRLNLKITLAVIGKCAHG
ncbi:hypothetical protein [Sandarakinorhabdus limnophila]|uniref:hypothetical protein n=1 Tax=Sandarakinorhabdus limnophila TaxID=210512 RepID=UPI0026EF2CBF|nr:hypothetical protein [Sandarakinorhabdus limnophila]